MKLRRLLPLALAFPVALLQLASGCSRQGEGERCSHLNNDPTTGESNDCAEGLVCTPGSTLGSNTDICCLSNGQSTVPACVPGGSSTGSGGGSSSSSTTASSSSTTASSSSSTTGTGGGGGGGGSDAGP